MSNYEKFMGWRGSDPAVLREALRGAPGEIHIVGSGPTSRRMMLFELTRKVLGKDTDNYPQQIGDCTSFGTKNACEYLACAQIATGHLGEFKSIFPPYIYGCERVYIGHSTWGDGGVGVWAAQACEQYGVLPSDTPNCPEYSGSVAKSWGHSDNGFRSFVETGKQHLVKKTAKVSTWEQLVQSITNLYPVTVCSNQGFSMHIEADGFNRPQGVWSHCMCIIGVDDDGGNVEPHGCILNSWGDVFGEITDLRDPSLKWPVGTLRVRKSVIERMLSQDDSWAFSAFDDFPAQVLKPSDFSMI